MSEEEPEKPRADKTVAMPMMGSDTLTSLSTDGVRGLADAASHKAANPRVVICNEAIKEIVPIDKMEFIFGRNAAAGADHILDHPAISGAHCKIFFRNDRFYVQDLESKNNTYVDGEMRQGETAKEIRGEMPFRIGAVEALFVTDCDENGRKIDVKRYRSALRLLEAEGSVSAIQGDKAQRDASGIGAHAGELLLTRGFLRVEDWVRAFQRGEMFDLIRKESTASTKKYALLILVQWIIIVALILILLLKPDLVAGLWGGGN